MVGVPGKSKACGNCRATRRRCDLVRPSCTQCVRAGQQCEGYERKRIFVNTTASSAAPRHGLLMPVQYRTGGQESLPVKRSTREDKPDSAHTKDITLPEALTRSAYYEQYLGCFWDEYNPKGSSFSTSAMRYTTCAFMKIALGSYSDEPVLKQALLGVSFATVASRDNQTWLGVDGARMYGMALKEMANALHSPARPRGDSMVIACRLLGFYEMFYGGDGRPSKTQTGNWKRHNIGSSAIVQARGPSGVIEGHAHQLFVDFRLHAAMIGIKDRQRSVLSQIQWKTTPWLKVMKTPKDFLYDTLIDIPGLLEDMDKLGTAEEKARERVLNDCLRLQGELENWYAVWSPPKTFDNSTELPERLSADEFAMMHSMVVYWSACVIIYDAILAVQQTDDTAKVRKRAEMRQYLRYIVEVLPYLLSVNAGKYGMYVAAFPLCLVVKFVFEPKEVEAMREEKLLLKKLFYGKDGQSEMLIKYLHAFPAVASLVKETLDGWVH